MLEIKDSIGKASTKFPRSGSGLSRNKLQLVQVMNSSQLQPDNSEVIEVNSWADRWQVYRRLQELGIPCSCEVEQPLRVQINNPNQAVQLSSVLKQFTASRGELVQNLERSWNIECD